MDWDPRHIIGLSAFVAVLVTIMAAHAMASKRARSIIARWAAEQGLSGVRLHSTSFRSHPQVGTARTGDVTYRLTAHGTDGQPVTGFVKCSTFNFRGSGSPIVQARLTPAPVRGFPVRPLSPPAEGSQPTE